MKTVILFIIGMTVAICANTIWVVSYPWNLPFGLIGGGMAGWYGMEILLNI